MAIVLTNGTYYIAHDAVGAIIKVTDINQAQDFYSVERAIKQKQKCPGKCKNYYYIDTDIAINKEDNKQLNKSRTTKCKRKSFSKEERLQIYRKTEGHCYLCGDFVDFNMFEVEHKIPLAKGGTNDLDNVFCSCHECNTIKRDIYPANLMEKVTKIFLYQMEMKHGNKLIWRIVHRVLVGMV